MRLAHAGLRHGLLAVCSTDSSKCTVCSAHVTVSPMAGKNDLLCLGAHRVGEKLDFFDCASQVELAEAKTNELEQQHQIQGWRSRF